MDRTLILGTSIAGLSSFNWDDINFVKENLGRYDTYILNLETIPFKSAENIDDRTSYFEVSILKQSYITTGYYLHQNVISNIQHMNKAYSERKIGSELSKIAYIILDLGTTIQLNGDDISLGLYLVCDGYRLKVATETEEQLSLSLIKDRIFPIKEEQFYSKDLIIQSGYESLFFDDMEFNTTFRIERSQLYNDRIAYTRWDRRVSYLPVTTSYSPEILLFQIPTNYRSQTYLHIILDFLEIPYNNWINANDLQLENIIEIESEKNSYEENFNQKMKELTDRIEKVRNNYDHLYNLLQKDGDDLKYAVMKCFKQIGFVNVIDVDELNNTQKVEDIEISDLDPILIIEVKGVKGQSKESETNVVAKYVGRRQKQNRNKNFQGLSIINTEKNDDPRQRSVNFTQAQVEDANNFEYGILQTWTLYQLVRGYIKWQWDETAFKSIFFQIGEISPIPPFFKKIGSIYTIYKKIGVVSILVENEFEDGDTIIFYLNFRYFQEKITSMQNEHNNVKKGKIGERIGIKLSIYNLLKKGNDAYILINKK